MIPITTQFSITNITTRSLHDYFADISKYRTLTINEEKKLGYLIIRGSKKAKDKLVKANLKFAITVAKHYQGRGLPLEDLIAEANAGMCRAADTWNPNLGYKFITYALWWMRQTITRALTNKSRTIRIAQNPVDIQFRINRELQRYIQKYGKTPDDDTLAELCRCTVKQLHNAINANLQYSSFDNPCDSSDPDAPTLLEVIPDENSKITEEKFEKKDIRQAIVNILSSYRFSELEKGVVLDHFGFNNDMGKTLSYSALMRIHKVNYTQLRETLRMALAKLRKYYKRTLLNIMNNDISSV